MHELVIQIDKTGAINTLLKDNVFDTSLLNGKRNIERVSIIEFNKFCQKFYVRFLSDQLITQNGSQYLLDKDCYVRFFGTYELAVEAEVNFINMLRKSGVLINGTETA